MVNYVGSCKGTIYLAYAQWFFIGLMRLQGYSVFLGGGQ